MQLKRSVYAVASMIRRLLTKDSIEPLEFVLASVPDWPSREAQLPSVNQSPLYLTVGEVLSNIWVMTDMTTQEHNRCTLDR